MNTNTNIMAGHRHHDPSVPRAALIAAATLIGVALLTAAAGRLGGGRPSGPQPEPLARAELLFTAGAEGTVVVSDAGSGRLVEVLPADGDGFIRGVLRGVARDRMLHKLTGPAPLRLTYWADGRLSLRDTATGRYIDLSGFGQTNVRAFARLLRPDAAQARSTPPAYQEPASS